MSHKPLLGYLVSHPIQYQAPLFRRLGASEKIDFIALFGSDFGVRPSYDPQFGQVVDFGVDLLKGYRSVFIKQASSEPSIERFLGLRTPSLGTLWEAAPALDAVILHGWRTAMMWQAAGGAWLRKRPYFMRAETPAFDTEREPVGALKRVRNVAVRLLLNQAAGALALGSANERFYLRKGYPPERIHRVPYFVDNDAVAVAAAEGREERDRVRAELGVPGGSFAIVAVGKLMPGKRPLDLVRILPMLEERVHLIWVGSGEMEDAVRSTAAGLGVGHRLHLVGFRPTVETWQIMGASDLFVQPSESETWGLVINEAVVAGMPAVVSARCGAAEDLIVPGRTGEVVPVGDSVAWTSAIQKWVDRVTRGDQGDTQEMRQIADAHSIERAAAAIEEVVFDCTSHRE